MSNIFSSENDVILIEEVCQNTGLYDSKDVKLKDVLYEGEIWKHNNCKIILLLFNTQFNHKGVSKLNI